MRITINKLKNLTTKIRMHFKEVGLNKGEVVSEIGGIIKEQRYPLMGVAVGLMMFVVVPKMVDIKINNQLSKNITPLQAEQKKAIDKINNKNLDLRIDLTAFMNDTKLSEHANYKHRQDVVASIEKIMAAVDMMQNNELTEGSIPESAVDAAVLSHELDSLRKDVLSLKTEVNSPKQTKNKVLPFDVISLDYWNGAPYATVEMAGRHEIIGMKESKSGWQLVSIDMENSEVVFKGKTNNSIKVKV